MKDVTISAAQDTADAEARNRLLDEYFGSFGTGVPASDAAAAAYREYLAAAHYTTAADVDAWCDLCGTWLAECDCD